MWTTISGVNEWSWSEDASSADTSDFDNAGWGSDMTATRKATLGITGQYKVDELTGERDAGQLMAETAAHDFGASGFRWLRVEALNTARTNVIGHIIVQASVNLGETGGGMEGVQPFNIECLVQGQPIGSGIYDTFSLS